MAIQLFLVATLVSTGQLVLAAPAIRVQSSGSTSYDVTVFYQNDGNWTNHGEKPSALFVNSAVSYTDAVGICESYGELLLSCESFGDFHNQFTYQQYLGNLNKDTTLWSNCSSNSPTNWEGSVLSTTNSSATLPFLCTNTAPQVSTVDTDYSTFPRVNTSANGTTFEGLRDHMAFRFLGVPFAKPPVGELRFKHAKNWTGSYVNATAYQTGCLQYGWFAGNSYGLNPWGNSEDCLYLEVFTSSLPSESSSAPLKPVMFWMHGGSQTTGTGSDSTFDGASLASRSDVVVVSINYRLNIFGYLTLNDSVITGNYALSDKIAALQWVQKYIKAFGGDPDKVTIFGQSAGGGSVIDLVTSPKAAGLFTGSIQQSAGRGHDIESSTAAAEAIPYLNAYCNGTNGTGSSRLACLQALPAETLLNLTYSELTSWDTPIDGDYVIDYPISQLAKGGPYINRVHFMGTFMPEEAQSLLEEVLSPNVTSFEENIGILVNHSQINQEQANTVLTSGLWLVSNETYSNGSSSYTSAYNASINVATNAMLSCFSNEWATTASVVGSYDSMWLGMHQRGYALSYYDYYDLCTFPVGKPETPYYRCHSSDLYEVFGTAYLFDQPVRATEDIYYVNAIQDMWASFARTHNPNVEAAYLEARGYNSTVEFFENWSWPEYHSYDTRLASFQWPQAHYTWLPDQRHCEALLPSQILN